MAHGGIDQVGPQQQQLNHRARRRLARRHLQAGRAPTASRNRVPLPHNDGPAVATLVVACDCAQCRLVREAAGRRAPYDEPGDLGRWPGPAVKVARDRLRGHRVKLGPPYPLSYECRQLQLAPTAPPEWRKRDEDARQARMRGEPDPDDLVPCDCPMCRAAAVAELEWEVERIAAAGDRSPMAAVTGAVEVYGVKVVPERTRLARGRVVADEDLDGVEGAVVGAMREATEARSEWVELPDGKQVLADGGEQSCV